LDDRKRALVEEQAELNEEAAGNRFCREHGAHRFRNWATSGRLRIAAVRYIHTQALTGKTDAD